MVFQDPYSSLDPRQTVGSIIAEPLRIFRAGSARHIRARVEALLAEVGLDPRALRRYPHEFSGGQRQRIGIARALAPDPRLLVCDEPVSALDVSIQGQIVNLLLEQQERRGLSMLFISHDLTLVRRIASRLSVIYRGRIVEEGPSESVFTAPAHPYTRALLEAASIPAGEEDACRLPGSGPADVLQSSGWQGGCAFAARCGFVLDRCRREAPGLEALPGRPEHRTACFLIAESCFSTTAFAGSANPGVRCLRPSLTASKCRHPTWKRGSLVARVASSPSCFATRSARSIRSMSSISSGVASGTAMFQSSLAPNA